MAKAERVRLRWNAPQPEGGVVPRDVEGRLERRIGPEALARAAAWRELLVRHGEDDADWDWGRCVEEEGGERLNLALWAQGDLQGLMILEVSGVRLPLLERCGPHLFVEYLNVAPWNRSRILRPRRLEGCGAVLMDFAFKESRRRGWRGRLALNALPGSLGFYEKQGLLDLGPAPDEEGCRLMAHPGILGEEDQVDA